MVCGEVQFYVQREVWYDSLLGNVRRFKRSNSGGKVMDVNTQIRLELLLGTPDT